ncbi:MAG: adenylyltransferase/cytidyltransferase family protein [Candidatus Azambacteria bacterium]|nr:adenylyltransferase/cytidyltransferase family protein [Candidatus Azambacteria bacterium]
MISINKLSKELKKLADKKIVLLGGCFDILHIGHLRFIEKAKKFGDILVIGINDDRFIKKTKGNHRPIIPEKQRAELLLGLKAVDYVFVTNKALYDDENLKKIKPNFLVFANETDKIKRRKDIAKNIENKFKGIKTIFLSSGVNKVRTSLIEDKIIKSKINIS